MNDDEVRDLVLGHQLRRFVEGRGRRHRHDLGRRNLAGGRLVEIGAGAPHQVEVRNHAPDVVLGRPADDDAMGRMSVVEIAAQLGHNPTVCLDTNAHVTADGSDLYA